MIDKMAHMLSRFFMKMKNIDSILRMSCTVVATLLLLLLVADGTSLGTARETADGAPPVAAALSEPQPERGFAPAAQAEQVAAAPQDAGQTAGGARLADAGGGEPHPEQPAAIAEETPYENPADAELPGEEGEPDGQAQPTDADDNAAVQSAMKIAYITIDDGPTRAITPGMLDVLEHYGVKATFFVLPHNGVEDLYRRIIDEGHEIGNHSYSHVYARLYNSGDLDAFREDVIRARDFMLENFDYLTTTFRFPGGMMGRSSGIVAPRREILEELGYNYFDWNSDTGDAGRSADKSAAALTRNVLRNTQGRERLIVLMHDTRDKKTTLEALPLIIEGLREQGYVFDVLRNYGSPNPGPATPTSLP